MKTWRGRPATNPSGSDNLLARVWALVSSKYSLFGVRRSSERDASTLTVLRAFIRKINACWRGDVAVKS